MSIYYIIDCFYVILSFYLGKDEERGGISNNWFTCAFTPSVGKVVHAPPPHSRLRGRLEWLKIKITKKKINFRQMSFKLVVCIILEEKQKQ